MNEEKPPFKRSRTSESLSGGGERSMAESLSGGSERSGVAESLSGGGVAGAHSESRSTYNLIYLVY